VAAPTLTLQLCRANIVEIAAHILAAPLRSCHHRHHCRALYVPVNGTSHSALCSVPRIRNAVPQLQPSSSSLSSSSSSSSSLRSRHSRCHPHAERCGASVSEFVTHVRIHFASLRLFEEVDGSRSSGKSASERVSEPGRTEPKQRAGSPSVKQLFAFRTSNFLLSISLRSHRIDPV